MSIGYEERVSDSPYVETITHGRMASDGSSLRPAESCWHMVLVRQHDNVQLLVVGPLTKAGVVSWTEGAEVLWIKFKLGTFLPHLPARDFLDGETILPEAASQSFWLNGSAWQFPDYENVDTFVDWLVRDGMLVRDEIVDAVLQNQLIDVSLRSIQRRFRHATGLTHSMILQMERARFAKALLQQGISIMDTMDQAGYYDQSHLTRSLKRFIGRTPAQIAQSTAIKHSSMDWKKSRKNECARRKMRDEILCNRSDWFCGKSCRAPAC
jgi:AraC-like DNA-binding protein